MFIYYRFISQPPMIQHQQTLINQNLDISQTYINFSQRLSMLINVYCCKGIILLNYLGNVHLLQVYQPTSYDPTSTNVDKPKSGYISDLYQLQSTFINAYKCLLLQGYYFVKHITLCMGWVESTQSNACPQKKKREINQF